MKLHYLSPSFWHENRRLITLNHESWQVLVTPVLMAELLDMFRQPCSIENHFWYEYSELSVSVYNRHSWIKNNMFIHEYCTHRFSLNQSNLEKLTKRDTEINTLTVPRDLVGNIRSLIYANIRNVKKIKQQNAINHKHL